MAVSEQELPVPSDDGARLALWRVGNGQSLLLVHDTAEDHTRWRPLYPALTARYAVHAMDRRGRGGSTDGPAYAAQREFEDLSEVLTRLPGPVDALGLGWGAICLLGAARRVPTTTIRRLVLYEPPVPVDAGPSRTPPVVLERIQNLVSGGDRERAVGLYLAEVLGLNGAEVEEQKTLPAWRGRLGAARTIPREVRARDDLRFDVEGLRELPTPTMVLGGAASPDLRRRSVARLAGLLPAGRRVELPGVRQMAVDSAPELFLREVLGFFSS